MRDDGVYLDHIAESIRRIEQYLGGVPGTPEPRLFYEDPRTQDAVLRRLETAADAASRLSRELKARHPAIPWRQIGAFRNILAHGYMDLDLDQVWQAVANDLTALRTVIDEERGFSP